MPEQFKPQGNNEWLVYITNAAKNFAQSTAKSAVQNAFKKCQIDYCERMSLGMVCSDCSRILCQEHVLIRPTVPPYITCDKCVVLDYRKKKK